MKPSEILIAAKGLIDAPEKWNPQHEVDERPISLINAIWDGYENGAMPLEYLKALVYARKLSGKPSLSIYEQEDGRTWEDIVGLLDRAIAAAREAGE